MSGNVRRRTYSPEISADIQAKIDAATAPLHAELADLRAELELVKCGEPNHPDRAYAMKGWLKTFGFKVYCELRHGAVDFVLSLLQAGEITRSKAAEAIAELLVGGEPPLPVFQCDVFSEDEIPREVVAALRAELEAAKREAERLDWLAAHSNIEVTQPSGYGRFLDWKDADGLRREIDAAMEEGE